MLEVLWQNHFLKSPQIMDSKGTHIWNTSNSFFIPFQLPIFNLHRRAIVFRRVGPTDYTFKLLFLEDCIGFLDEIVNGGGN